MEVTDRMQGTCEVVAFFDRDRRSRKRGERREGREWRTLSAFVLVGFRVRNGGCWRLWLAGARWKSAAGFWKVR